MAIVDPEKPWPEGWGTRRFVGKGEEAALRLASETEAALLVNERPAWAFALRHGLRPWNVPAFIAYLVSERLITAGTGLEALGMVERGHRTAQVFVDRTRAVLQEIEGDA